ncbi:hypothetical protein E1265_12830 [Streptomyces sp. 8K308]|nr:hypothetical protein E1265_12830 [Streptomyces sp. 8K308]
MATAGCGSHSAAIVDRSGATIAPAQTLTAVEWTRTLDDTSTASVTISPDGDCCERLGEVRAWRHRLVIWRDGEFVWDGPILRPEWTSDGLEIQAADIAAILDRRVPHQSVDFGGDSDLADIAAWLIEDGYAPADPGHEVQIVAPAGVRGARSYTRDVGQTGDHLRELAEAGIDYTVVGHTIVLLPETHTVSLGQLTDMDLPAGLTVVEDGAALATRIIVAGDEEADVMGEVGDIDEYYGLLERYVQQNSIPDRPSAEAAARALLRSSRSVPVWLDSAQVTLSPDAPVNVSRLVPGWCLDVTSTATCRVLSQRLKIVGVRVREAGGTAGQPGSESVQVQLAATGAEAGS